MLDKNNMQQGEYKFSWDKAREVDRARGRADKT